MVDGSPGRTVDRLVAYALVWDGYERLLLLRRAEGPPGLVGLWEPPGGKVDPGEQPLEAAVRELREETGLEVERSPHVGFNGLVCGYKEAAAGLFVLPWSGSEGQVRCVAAYYQLALKAPASGRDPYPPIGLTEAHSECRWVARKDLPGMGASLQLTSAFRAMVETIGW